MYTRVHFGTYKSAFGREMGGGRNVATLNPSNKQSQREIRGAGKIRGTRKRSTEGGDLEAQRGQEGYNLDQRE